MSLYLLLVLILFFSVLSFLPCFFYGFLWDILFTLILSLLLFFTAKDDPGKAVFYILGTALSTQAWKSSFLNISQ